jgi:hypothetical protein
VAKFPAPTGTAEAAALILRRGDAGSDTAEDHITGGRLALNQIPALVKGGRRLRLRLASGRTLACGAGWIGGVPGWSVDREVRPGAVPACRKILLRGCDIAIGVSLFDIQAPGCGTCPRTGRCRSTPGSTA